MQKPYKFTRIKDDLPVERQGGSRVFEEVDATDPKPLTGQVQGQRASEPEERFARALYANGYIEFQFQYELDVLTTIIGRQGKVIDFLVYISGRGFAVEIDGYGHDTIDQKGEDAMRDAQLAPELVNRNIDPDIIRIGNVGVPGPRPEFNIEDLMKQSTADALVRRMFR